MRSLPRARDGAGRGLRRRHRHLPPGASTSPPTTSAGPTLEGCNEILVRSPGPTSSPACTPPTSTSAPTSSRPTRSAPSPSRSASTASPTGPTSSTLAAARIAREVADDFATPDRPRFVAGSIGPGHQVRRRSARSASPTCATPTRSRPAGLLEGGVDLLSSRPSSTCSASRRPIIGARRAMAAAGREVPLQVQVTIELTGRMLPGTEIGAALAALDAAAARRHRPQLRHRPGRDGRAPAPPVPALPHADLVPAQRRPAVGRRRQDALRPHPRAAGRATTRRFITELGVQVVGGCCGTTPEHIRPLVDAVPGPHAGRRATPVHEPGATSIYSPVPFEQDTVVPDHRRAHQRQRLQEVPRRACSRATGTPASQMAKDQVKEGAHVLDVCVDYVGRDGTVDMDEIASRFATQADASRWCSTPPSPR